MSFQASPQTNLAPPGTQGNMMPGYLPPTGLPPPPTFPGFPNTPPTGPSQPGIIRIKSGLLNCEMWIGLSYFDQFSSTCFFERSVLDVCKRSLIKG